jgi:Ca-activated chloride channel family protein
MQWLALQHLWVLAIIPVIIILYLLKRKYENVEISSILLWQQMLRDQEANRPWQKLQRNLLLFLQLLIAILLILALLKPAILVDGVVADHTVLVLDSSGSMLAKEGEATRFELAKQEAGKIIDHLGSGQSLTIIEVGKEPKIHISKTQDKSSLYQALAQIQARPGVGDYRSALSLATAIVNSESEVGLIWFGDGDNGHLLSSPELLRVTSDKFHHAQIGQSRENVSIATFVSQKRQDKTEGLIRIDNHGLTESHGRLTIYDDSGDALDDVPFSVQGRGSYTLTFANLPDRNAYKAELSVEGDGLEEDNQLWSVPFLQGKIKAVLVSAEGNRFLSQSLTLGDRIYLERMTDLPEKMDESVDLWIFDRVVPDKLPKGNMLLISLNESTEWMTYLGQKEINQTTKVTNDKHTLLQYVDWRNVYVSQATSVEPITGMESLVKAGDNDVLFAGDINGRKTVLLGFDLHHSDFPLQTGFPIFIQNVVSWLSPTQSLPLASGYPGEHVTLFLTPGAEKRVVTLPHGEKEELSVEATSFLYQIPEQTGLYHLEEIRGGEKIDRYFSVSMRESESNIRPYHMVAPSSVGNEEESTEMSLMEKKGRKDLTFWLAAMALIFCLVEWVVYHRGY